MNIMMYRIIFFKHMFISLNTSSWKTKYNKYHAENNNKIE